MLMKIDKHLALRENFVRKRINLKNVVCQGGVRCSTANQMKRFHFYSLSTLFCLSHFLCFSFSLFGLLLLWLLLLLLLLLMLLMLFFTRHNDDTQSTYAEETQGKNRYVLIVNWGKVLPHTWQIWWGSSQGGLTFLEVYSQDGPASHISDLT